MTYSLPIAIGSPLAPKSPRPNIREPTNIREKLALFLIKHMGHTIGDDSDPSIVGPRPIAKDLLNTTLVMDRDIEALRATPDT
jgi:hypothetical protein